MLVAKHCKIVKNNLNLTRGDVHNRQLRYVSPPKVCQQKVGNRWVKASRRSGCVVGKPTTRNIQVGVSRLVLRPARAVESSPPQRGG
jgi:hypothetical protein